MLYSDMQAELTTIKLLMNTMLSLLLSPIKLSNWTEKVVYHLKVLFNWLGDLNFLPLGLVAKSELVHFLPLNHFFRLSFQMLVLHYKTEFIIQCFYLRYYLAIIKNSCRSVGSETSSFYPAFQQWDLLRYQSGMLNRFLTSSGWSYQTSPKHRHNNLHNRLVVYESKNALSMEQNSMKHIRLSTVS